MLISLGDLKCTIGTQRRFFSRILRLLDGSSRLSCGCSCRRSMAALLFHPNSAQHATTSHPYLVNNISTTRGFYDSRRFLYRTDSGHDIPTSGNDEKLQQAAEAIQNEHKEKKPMGLFAKLKYYLKRYWYIAIPIHIVNCSLWFALFYIAVKSGVDVVPLLEKCHFPNYVVDKVKSVPSNAGTAVVALFLYKIASPLRFATTLLLIQLCFPVLRKFGIMTVKEVKYKMRLKYATKMRKISGRYQQKFNQMTPHENKKRQSTGSAKK